MEWLPTVVSAILSALIAAGVSWFGVLTNVRQRSILEARQSWRNELRGLLPQFTGADSTADRERLRDAITLLLNPYKDRGLVSTLDDYIADPTGAHRRAVISSFAEYLKHDWQRAKAEVFHRSDRADRIATKEVEEQRKDLAVRQAREPAQ